MSSRVSGPADDSILHTETHARLARTIFPYREDFFQCGYLCRLVTLAAGAAAGKFLKYEHKAPTVAAQTAYGIEVELDGYEAKYDESTMLFMDFRRHHSGLWDGTAPK